MTSIVGRARRVGEATGSAAGRTVSAGVDAAKGAVRWAERMKNRAAGVGEVIEALPLTPSSDSEDEPPVEPEKQAAENPEKPLIAQLRPEGGEDPVGAAFVRSRGASSGDPVEDLEKELRATQNE